LKSYPETHQEGLVSFENADIIHEKFSKCWLIEADLGVQIASDGRIWICIDGIAFIRFKPKKAKIFT
jgi:hypothetical protein